MYCVAMYKNRVVLFFVINYTHSFIHPSSRLRWIWRLSQEYFVMRQENILGGIFHHRATHTHLFIYIVNKRLYIFIDFSSSFFKSSRAFSALAQENLITNVLTDRKRFVSVGQNASEPRSLGTGAPRGCVLSPSSYSIYTYDCAFSDASAKSQMSLL